MSFVSRAVSSRCGQHGVTLFVTLVMLLVITALALTVFRGSTTSLKVVGNMQAQQALERAMQSYIESFIGTAAFFTDAAKNTGTWPAGKTSLAPTNVNGYTVTVYRPTCISATPIEGSSATFLFTPDDTAWNIRASGTDPATGARAEIHQQIRVRLATGYCP
jgi:Tfp pilus assembly protein PilX